jgi:C-terminal processing protease CtpA/Prc
VRNATLAATIGVLLLLGGSEALAQEPDLESILRFEEPRAGDTLPGWGGGPPETIHFDSTLVHSGNGAARLERDAGSSNTFSTITKRLSIGFGGDSLELRGFLRTEGVSEFAGLWMREDGPSGQLQFDNMRSQGLRGTTDWTEYAIRLPLDPRARDLFFGVLVVGEGKVWADDLQLLVDGKPMAEAPERVVEPTILDTDHEFDNGSGITATSLSQSQVQNLATLGMVWGFLKYHHPRIAKGELHWDYELFRVLPVALDAPDRNALNRILSQWLDRLGVPDSCSPCAQPPQDAHLVPRLDWIADVDLLSPELSRQLQNVYAYRFADGAQFYVSQTLGVGNPVFDRELAYTNYQPPDAGLRILALLRLWNIIEYWFPYRDQLDDDWHVVLQEFLPRFVVADSWDAYRLELLALITRIQDGHANLWSGLDVRPPRGSCHWPVDLRFIEGRVTVAAFTDEAQGRATGLEIGDVIKAVDGQPVDSLVAAWSPYYSASNQSTRMRDIARSLTRGDCGQSRLNIERRGEPLEFVMPRLAKGDPKPVPHDRPGETFQLLSPEVAYVKLSSIHAQDIEDYLAQASGTRGLVIDIRNYPSEFVVFALGSRLVQEPTPFARFTAGDLDNPGSFTWTPSLTLEPASTAYKGKVAILVDEVSISQAEYTAMALRAGPQAVVVGSTTAGADGNVSSIQLPGGLRTMISGIGVFYPNKTPTQRVGIVPDIVATPTIAGIRDGRDEPLEAALRHILGPDADEEMIRGMARRPEAAGDPQRR